MKRNTLFRMVTHSLALSLFMTIGCEQDSNITMTACADCPGKSTPGSEITTGGNGMETAATSCSNLPDLRVRSLTIFELNNTVFQFGISIENIGGQTANISSANRVVWDAYLSKDGVIRDKLLGDVAFTQALTPGQISGTSTMTASPAADFNEYRFLIITVWLVPFAECSIDNNKTSFSLPVLTCANNSLPDLIVNSVVFNGRSGNTINFGVVVKNIGSATATMTSTNFAQWQAWLSKNGVTRDRAACSSAFMQSLGSGQISPPSIVNCTMSSEVNLNDFHFMIVDLKSVPFTECSNANNTLVTPFTP